LLSIKISHKTSINFTCLVWTKRGSVIWTPCGWQ